MSAVQRCMDAGMVPRQDAFAVATSLWTGLHGIVSLRLSKPGFPWPPVEDLVDRLLEGVVGVEIHANRPQRKPRNARALSAPVVDA